ncbi:hypothetical protein [Puniceibacterium sediminis]|uniref:Uncharacterized protein n=1 Tax=Puniceibacterium sediminis TaxID=1608407 RepID=A0A238WAD4_9RHOB|nr:hypothetical protein [Puniceibacterium sediminis]SNR43234.1 hypothetical protein SAMN06265370_1051 [Puniceibacterium sediminis]
MTVFQIAAQQLAGLYGKNFGGKATGRYRLSSKQVKELLGRKRLYADDIDQLTRAALEEGLVLIDMDSFFVVLSANAFVNYRRVSAEALAAAMSGK